MKLTNKQIYNYALYLIQAFDDKEQSLPIKLNFVIQKNKQNLLVLAQEIEKARLEIAKKYGEYDANTNQFIIAEAYIERAQEELNGLLELEQEVNVRMIKTSNLSDECNLTAAQMEAIMFMIEEA